MEPGDDDDDDDDDASNELTGILYALILLSLGPQVVLAKTMKKTTFHARYIRSWKLWSI